MAYDDNPAEEFRRITAATMRAIAENDEITVTFGSEARLTGTQARLPTPSREMTKGEIAHLRG